MTDIKISGRGGMVKMLIRFLYFDIYMDLYGSVYPWAYNSIAQEFLYSHSSKVQKLCGPDMVVVVVVLVVVVWCLW